MSIVNIRNIQLLNNPARFEDPYNIRIVFECVEPLQEDLEWKLLYVGDAKTEDYDQELDSCMVGPVPVGVSSFDFSASAPQPKLLPSTSSDDILGVTVLILTGSYRDKEFVRVGYYVNTEYEDEARRLEPPSVVDFSGLIRNVLVEKPRVTRFNCQWDKVAASQAVVAAGLQAASNSGGGSSQPSDKDMYSNSPVPPPVTASAAPPPAPSPANVGTPDVDMA